MDTFLARSAAAQLVHDALFLPTPDRVKQFIQDLPFLPKDQVPLEDSCPICLVPFVEVLNPLEARQAPTDFEDKKADETGVTKLDGCGHIFCRRDLIEWVKTEHGSCPTCRFQFIPIDISPYGEDDGSSDGGEYLPPSEGDEDIDADYSEPDHWAFDVEDYEDDLDSILAAHEENVEHEALDDNEELWEPDPDLEEPVGVEEADYEHPISELEYSPELTDEMEAPPYDPEFMGEVQGEIVEESEYCPECFAEDPTNGPELHSDYNVEDVEELDYEPEILGGVEGVEDDDLEESEGGERDAEWGSSDREIVGSAASASSDDELW